MDSPLTIISPANIYSWVEILLKLFTGFHWQVDFPRWPIGGTVALLFRRKFPCHYLELISQFLHFLAVWPWESYLLPLCLSFWIWIMGTSIGSLYGFNEILIHAFQCMAHSKPTPPFPLEKSHSFPGCLPKTSLTLTNCGGQHIKIVFPLETSHLNYTNIFVSSCPVPSNEDLRIQTLWPLTYRSHDSDWQEAKAASRGRPWEPGPGPRWNHSQQPASPGEGP